MKRSNFKDITNQVINGIKVVSYSHNDKVGLAHWNVICRCGKEYKASGADIRLSRTSCGCTRKRRNRTDLILSAKNSAFIKSKIGKALIASIPHIGCY